jgi:hypothetical protein
MSLKKEVVSTSMYNAKRKGLADFSDSVYRLQVMWIA